MKKSILKRFATIICMSILVFCATGVVHAENSEEEVFIDVPADFTVSNNGYTQLRLTWNEVEDVDGYRIYRSNAKDGVFTEVAITEELKYIDKKLVTDQKYYYKINAYKGEYDGEFTEIKSGTPKVIVPKMKKTVNATSSSIEVSWNQPTGAHGYYVYRKQGDEDSWEKIASIDDPETTSFKDKTAEGRYYYTVRAYKDVDEQIFTSLRADSIQASVLKKASITVSQKESKRAVTVKWKKISNATGYQVYKKIGNNGEWVLAKTMDEDARSYSSEIPQGKNTYWKVRAIRKIDDTTTYASYSSEKKYSFATPKIEFTLLTDYKSSVKSIKVKVKNNGNYKVRFYSENNAVVNESDSSYDRALYLANSGEEQYCTINAGKKKTLNYKVEGNATNYRGDSVLCLSFWYDGLDYVYLTYADESYQEVLLAEDLWAQ